MNEQLHISLTEHARRGEQMAREQAARLLPLDNTPGETCPHILEAVSCFLEMEAAGKRARAALTFALEVAQSKHYMHFAGGVSGG